MFLVSVIYSFRNEEFVLKELVRRTCSVLENLDSDYEIIFVNDNSTDNSLAILKKMNLDNSKVKIINLSSRFGQVQGILAGLSYARGDCAVFLDSDLQDPPELITEMYCLWRSGAKVVHSERTKRRGEPLVKMFLTKLAYRFINMTSQNDIPVDSGDYKLLDRAVIDILKKTKEEAPYLRGIVASLGFEQKTVSYERDARLFGKTHFPFLGGDPIETFFIGVTSFSITPLYFPFFIAGVVTLFTLLLLGFSYISFFQASLLGLFSLLFFSLGVMGCYLGRIHFQSRSRELFLVRDTVGFP